MKRSLCLCLALGCLAWLATAPGDAQGPPVAGGDGKAAKAAGPPSAKGAGDRSPKRPDAQSLKLGPGVTVLYEDLKDGLKGPPRAYVLTPEAYQDLLDRSAQLERLLKPERRPPAECRLKASVEGDFVQVHAEFVLVTRQPRTSVALGCRGAQVTESQLRPLEGEGDAGPPLLDWSATGGYSVLIEKAGTYRLNLNLRLPLSFSAGTAARGAERGFELALPGAAVNTLTLELPYAVKEIRLNEGRPGKAVQRARPPGGKQKRWEDVPLGAATGLLVTWQEPVGLPEGGPLRTARGQVVVRLEEGYAQAVAELTLQDLRGRAREWRLWLPPQAKLRVTPPEGISCQVSGPDRNHVHTLKLSEPTGEPIKVTATTQHARPLARWPVGPFAVLDAFRQDGSIEVRASPAAQRGVRLQYLPGPDVDQRDLPAGHAADLVAYFRYANVPVPPPGTPVNKGGLAPLEIELRLVRGKVETRVEHELRLLRGGDPQGGLKVQVTTRIHAKPPGDAVNYLDVQLPRAHPDTLAPLAGLNPAPFPGAVPWAPLALGALAPRESEWLIGNAEPQFPDAKARELRRARVPLTFSPKEPGATVVLKGEYTLPRGVRSVRLGLPRPLAVEEGARVKVEALDRSLELLVRGPAGEAPAPARHSYTAELEGAPAFVSLAWRPYRPELPVTVLADVTFHEGDAHVRQEITFQSAERQPGDAAQPLRVPAGARGLKVSGGWEELGRNPALGQVFAAPGAAAGAKAPLVVEYDFLLPRREGAGRKRERGKRESDEEEGRPFEVPLVWPEAATRAQTKVRLWSAAGTAPALVRPDPAELTWKDRGTEVVHGRGLPARVLLAEGLNPPLYLRLDPTPAGLAGVAVDRALVQVAVDEEGTEHYRARFLLSKASAPHVDIRLPAASAALSLRVRLGGEKVEPDFPRDLGKDTGKVARLRLPAGLSGKPVVLEVAYQLPRNQPEAEGLWQTALHPPEILGNVFLGRVRWQVALPGNWVPVVLGSDVHAEQEWGWQGWLPAPEPAVTAGELETWLTGAPATEEGLSPSLVCSRTSLEPLRVLRLPRQLWLLLCSGLLLLLGLGLYFAPVSHVTFWAAVAALGLGALAAAVLWPAALPAVLYGCAPGALVLVVLLSFQWLLHQRYHRQVVFMPGFKRIKPGSSLVRGGSNRSREPSTVDAPNSGSAPPPAVQGSSMKGK